MSDDVRALDLTGGRIALAAADEYGLPLSEFLSRRRHQPLARARQVAAHIMRRRKHLSYVQIARILRRRDPTTICHAVRRIDGLLAADPVTADRYAGVLRRLGLPVARTLTESET